MSEPVHDAACYTAFIEGWASAGFYGQKTSAQKCAPCVLWTEAYGSGSISGVPIGKSSYNCGASITLTATPAAGWQFTHWAGSFSTTSATLTFTLNSSMSIDAYFEQIPEAPPTSGGEEDAGDGTDCGDPNRVGCGSPILVDVGGRSYHLTAPSDGVRFDLRDEGVKRQVSWTDGRVENAFLARDLNGNGTIDSGAELFGNFTRLRSGARARNGFEALQELDGNGDGSLDANDFYWTDLLLWTDRNHDGISGADELVPIYGSPVVALETEPRLIGKRDRWGNTFRYMARAQFAAGENKVQRPVYDVFLRFAP